MKRRFTASIVREHGMYLAQWLDVDVASQGRRSEEALANLEEALELHFEPPLATTVPDLRKVEIGSA